MVQDSSAKKYWLFERKKKSFKTPKLKFLTNSKNKIIWAHNVHLPKKAVCVFSFGLPSFLIYHMPFPLCPQDPLLVPQCLQSRPWGGSQGHQASLPSTDLYLDHGCIYTLQNLEFYNWRLLLCFWNLFAFSPRNYISSPL